MMLLTKAIERKLPAIYSSGDKPPEEVKIIVKFFDPQGSWTWYATEYDPKTRIFFGLVRGHEVELGSFSLDELQAYRGRFGLGIERDLHFGTDRTLAEALAQRI